MREVGVGVQVSVFAGLLVLTTATMLLSQVPLGPFQAPVALGIAAAKGALIAFFFMHLVEQPRVYGVMLLGTLLLLAFFVGLVAADVATRSPGAAPAAAVAP